jgi:hypothetical protein
MCISHVIKKMDTCHFYRLCCRKFLKPSLEENFVLLFLLAFIIIIIIIIYYFFYYYYYAMMEMDYLICIELKIANFVNVFINNCISIIITFFFRVYGFLTGRVGIPSKRTGCVRLRPPYITRLF